MSISHESSPSESGGFRPLVDGSMRAFRPETMIPGEGVFIDPRELILDTDGALYIDGGKPLDVKGVFDPKAATFPDSSERGMALLARVPTDNEYRDSAWVAIAHHVERGGFYEAPFPILGEDSEQRGRAGFKPIQILGIVQRGNNLSGYPCRYVGDAGLEVDALDWAARMDALVAQKKIDASEQDGAVSEQSQPPRRPLIARLGALLTTLAKDTPSIRPF